MSAIQDSLDQCRALTVRARDTALTLKRAGALPDFMDMGPVGMSYLTQLQDQSANQRRYAVFKGWVYAAVHALATEASRQPVTVGRLLGKNGNGIPGQTKSEFTFPTNGKWLPQYIRKTMSLSMQQKVADTQMEIVPNHALVDLMEKPNPIQYRMQFVYSFVANLCLTGWAFVVGGIGKDGKPEFYSLPTSWIVPDHTKGAFQQFRIINPKNPTVGMDQEPLDRTQVAFAYLPNPTDPLSALAPAQAQSMAIRIDDRIQSSQVMFFENGLFPSAIVTIGNNPHPDVPGGIAPRLTPNQRRQVYAAIKKVSQGVANYGNPVILDGLIKSVERLTATQNEMGWEKSETKVRTRILSSYGVHPFILGEEMVGSYAQAFIVQDRFCSRVNVFLDMLSTIMSDFAPSLLEKGSEDKAAAKKSKSKMLVWWQEAQAKDQQREQQMWDSARNRDDVTQDEFRAFMGLPPDKDRNVSVINKTSVQPVAAIAAQVKAGTLEPEQAVAIFQGMGLPDDLAKKIAGDGPSEEDLANQQAADQGGGMNPSGADQANQDQTDQNAQAGGEATGDDSGGDYADYWKSVTQTQRAVDSLKSMDDIIREAQGLLVQ